MNTTDAIIFSLTIALGIIIAEFCKTIVQFLTELMFGEEEEEQVAIPHKSCDNIIKLDEIRVKNIH